MQIFRRLVLVCFMIIFFFVVGSFHFIRHFSKDYNEIVVGAKNCTEQQILSEMMSILLEKKLGVKVTRKFHLDGTMISFHALQSGDIDLYPEYTGTAMSQILHRRAIHDEQYLWTYLKDEFARRYQLKWLSPFGFENRYVLVAKETHPYQTISDFLENQNIFYGFDQEFYSREEGQKLIRYIQQEQGDSEIKLMDHSLLYLNLLNSALDVIDVYSTDGSLQAYPFKILVDDNNYFPSYLAAPLIRMDLIEKFPEIEEIIETLSGKLSDTIMQNLNYKVEKKGKKVYQVALDFLIQENLL